MVVCLEYLRCYHEDGNNFLFRIVTWDESWVHNFTKGALEAMPKSNKPLNAPSVLLPDFFPGGLFEDYQAFHAEIVKVEIGGVAIYRLFGESRRAKSYCHMYRAEGQRQAYF
ncbi:hypothetical protein TNCV_3276521 [Trichonephila clavipes]|nr:hypothetical protein TNCV_3276521 [Trichonephila clavipes]